MQLTQLLAAGLLSGFASAKTAALSRRAVDCYFETLPDVGATCESFANTWGLQGGAAEFMGLNPGVQCPTLDTSKAYCAMGTFTIEDPPATSAQPSSTTVPSSTQKPAPSATQPSNGITTPVPAQPSMYTDCDEFYLVKAGDTCLSIAAAKGIYDEQFLRWNSIQPDCSNLKVNYYTCVSLIGQVPGPARPQTPQTTSATLPKTTLVTSTKVTSTTTTSAGNGIKTPEPAQPEMVANCNKWHQAAGGTTCSQIIGYNKLTLAQFVAMNPSVRADCSGMWSGYFQCVDIVGGIANMPTTTTSTKAATPTPVVPGKMPGVSTKCDLFYKVKSGDTCRSIAIKYDITQPQFKSWNTEVNTSCSNLWVDYEVCVHIPGAVKLMPGTVPDCTKFHTVVVGDKCSVIAANAKITLADLRKWNTQVDAGCSNLRLGYALCVGF